MTHVWYHCFESELKVDPSQHNVLVTESFYNHKKNREKMTEIFFEHYGVQGFYAAIQGVLSLYSVGRTTGVVLDSGMKTTVCVPVYESFPMSHAYKKTSIAGRAVTEHVL